MTPIETGTVGSEPRKTFPDIQKLFTHPLVEPGDTAAENYEGWEVDHLGKPRFFLVGIREVCAKLRTFEMRRFYEKRAFAISELSQRSSWVSHIGTVLGDVAENQFNRVRNERAVTFERAVFVLVTFEVMYEEAIKRGDVGGSRFDVYDQLKVLPACYHLDGFSKEYLNDLRKTHPNALSTLVSGCGHTDTSIVTELADGYCVTRRTAVGIRNALKSLNVADGLGAVRVRPGSKLGRKITSNAENVRREDING